VSACLSVCLSVCLPVCRPVCLSLSKYASVLDLSVGMPTPTVAVPQYVTVFCINSQHAQHRVAVYRRVLYNTKLSTAR